MGSKVSRRLESVCACNVRANDRFTYGLTRLSHTANIFGSGLIICSLFKSATVTCPSPVVCLFLAVSANNGLKLFSAVSTNERSPRPSGGVTLKMCWFSHASPWVQTKVSIDVSWFPDQEKSMSPVDLTP